jgi:hypothetical protein
MLMWYLSNAAMHGNGRGDRALFLMLAPHKFGDGDTYGVGFDGEGYGEGFQYGPGSGMATGNGDGKYTVGYSPSLF